MQVGFSFLIIILDRHLGNDRTRPIHHRSIERYSGGQHRRGRPWASVIVEQAGTGYKQEVKSGAAGEFLFPSLPVGSYRLTVEMAGFSTYVQKGIGLEVGQSASQKVTLAVGAITQQVTVGGVQPGDH